MKLIFSLTFVFSAICAFGQNTVGLTEYEIGNTDGYVLFSPMTSTDTYLIDKCGEKVHEWTTSTYRPGLSCFLLEDGSLLRSGILDNPNFNEGGSGGILEKFDWNGNLTWTYTLSEADLCQHHDFKVLPNGNILVIVWDRYTNAQSIDNGKNTTYTNSHLWSEKIVELQPVGANGANVVWEWKLWDHLVQDFDNQKPNFGIVTDHPELVDLNYFPGQPTNMDWIHINSIDYNVQLDQILLSSHTLNEVWIIDHSTTTAQAAAHAGGNSGKGGDLLYRWGNPQSYDRGSPATKKLFGQHHATWIPNGFPNEGKLLVFNNGLGRPGTYSSVDIIDPPINSLGAYTIGASAFAPTNLFWSYSSVIPSDFYSSNISGVYPLSNGSFMITEGASGRFFEIDSTEEITWEYINPVAQSGIAMQGSTATNNVVFRCEFYPITYPAFTGLTLTPQGEIELNPSIPSICSTVLNISEALNSQEDLIVYPNPVLEDLNIVFDSKQNFRIDLFNAFGALVLTETNPTKIDVSTLKSGIYVLTLTEESGTIRTIKVIK